MIHDLSKSTISADWTHSEHHAEFGHVWRRKKSRNGRSIAALADSRGRWGETHLGQAVTENSNERGQQEYVCQDHEAEHELEATD